MTIESIYIIYFNINFLKHIKLINKTKFQSSFLLKLQQNILFILITIFLKQIGNLLCVIIEQINIKD